MPTQAFQGLGAVSTVSREPRLTGCLSLLAHSPHPVRAAIGNLRLLPAHHRLWTGGKEATEKWNSPFLLERPRDCILPSVVHVFVGRQGKVDHASLRPSGMGIVPQRSHLSAHAARARSSQRPRASDLSSMEFYGCYCIYSCPLPPADDLDGLLSELPEDFFSDPSWGCLKTGHPP